jgi:hypothetical protein
MAAFVPGQEVRMPCAASRGGPLGEAVVTVESAQGPISGFVRADAVTGEGEKAFLRAWIVNVTDDLVTVEVAGSFLTTAAGRAAVRADWASANLQPVGA